MKIHEKCGEIGWKTPFFEKKRIFSKNFFCFFSKNLRKRLNVEEKLNFLYKNMISLSFSER